MFFKDGVYTFTYDGHVCLTPNGAPAETENEALAIRIFEYIQENGDEMQGGGDILSWHYTHQLTNALLACNHLKRINGSFAISIPHSCL